MPVTRKDVAERAGVSPSVVSFVLNPGMRPVAAKTRDRVLAAIDELGYRPNAIAQALRRGGTSTIGLVQPDQTNPFFGELGRAIEDRALPRGYALLVGSTADDAAREIRYVQTFLDRKVDGLILIDSGAPTAVETALASGIPVVFVDRVAHIPGQVSVATDGRAGARVAVDHLVGLGHTRIACIAGPEPLHADERVEGWRTGLHEAGLSDDLLARGSFTRDAGVAAAERIVLRGATAILACSDVQAVGAITYCRSAGLRVPEDVSVIGFDGTALAQHTYPALTVVQQPIEELGRVALERLIERMNSPDLPPTLDVLPTRLVVRDSTAPRT